jgi:ketosteroid isomerase-like protein
MERREFLEDMAKRVFACMNSRDFESLKPDLSDAVVFDFPGLQPVEGPRRVVVFLNALMRKYKGLTFKISDIIIDEQENKACVVWTNFGEHLTGEDYQNSGITLIKFGEDKIFFLSDYFKDTSFIQRT